MSPPSAAARAAVVVRLSENVRVGGRGWSRMRSPGAWMPRLSGYRILADRHGKFPGFSNSSRETSFSPFQMAVAAVDLPSVAGDSLVIEEIRVGFLGFAMHKEARSDRANPLQ